MNRRSILKGLGLGGLFSLGLSIENKATTIPTNEATSYKSFEIKWSGWRTYPDTDKITGYWIAKELKGEKRFYACSGGYSGEYQIGAVFNCSVNHFINANTLADHEFLTSESSLEILEKEKSRALEALKLEINRYWYDDIEPE